MTTERRKHLEALFHEASTLAQAERTAFLENACADDATLKEQVETLLASHSQDTRPLDATELDEVMSAATLLYTESEKATLSAGSRQRVGPYRILSEIGQGGMGTVYLASRDDDLFDKQVAIKIVRRGMDSDAVVRRFRRERQILASLDHPNIARLFDGGTTEDGLPYFVMEYIEGKPLYAYCAANQLDTTARLELFRRVCAAVQYAHQNLIIHRDIKPGNILVTAKGEPKLLDFGIAKLVNPASADADKALTLASERVMTPQYASPEQVRGDAITTASDVYSLGIVLYELLTGQRPYRFKSNRTNDIIRVICEYEPERPSTVITRAARGDKSTVALSGKDAGTEAGAAADTKAGGRATAVPPAKPTAKPTASHAPHADPERLRKRLQGDLDNIVMKALNKEPERRYLSVDQFSEDIRRHLEGLPVIARPNTLVYRAGKFVRRHKLAVAAASLILLTLVAGIVGTTWQAARARAQQQRAERRFNDVRQLANSFLFEFHDGIANLSGSTPMRELVVKRALEYLDKLSQEAGGDASLQRELATAYEKVGEIQGDPYAASLGDTTSAMASYRKAQQIRETLLASPATSGTTGLRRELAKGYLKMGDILWVTGDLAAAREVFEKAKAIYEPLVETEPADAALRYDLSTNYIAIGDILMESGELETALTTHRRAMALREALAANPGEAKYRAGYGVSHVKIGDDLLRTGNLKEALHSYQTGIKILEPLAQEEPANAQFRQYLESTYQRLGFALLQDDNAELALDYLNKCVAFSERALAIDPRNAVAQRNLLGVYISIGTTLAAMEEYGEARAYFTKGMALATQAAANDPANAQARRDVIVAHYETARMSRKSGNYAEAERHYRQAREVAEAQLAADPASVQARQDLSNVYDGLGNLSAFTDKPQAAIGYYEKALPLREALAAEVPDNSDIQVSVSDTLYNLGQSLVDIATDRKLSASKKLEALRRARPLFARSQAILHRLRDAGTLAKVYEEKIKDLADALKKCDDEEKKIASGDRLGDGRRESGDGARFTGSQLEGRAIAA